MGILFGVGFGLAYWWIIAVVAPRTGGRGGRPFQLAAAGFDRRIVAPTRTAWRITSERHDNAVRNQDGGDDCLRKHARSRGKSTNSRTREGTWRLMSSRLTHTASSETVCGPCAVRLSATGRPALVRSATPHQRCTARQGMDY